MIGGDNCRKMEIQNTGYRYKVSEYSVLYHLFKVAPELVDNSEILIYCLFYLGFADNTRITGSQYFVGLTLPDYRLHIAIGPTSLFKSVAFGL